jgi:hypothetical protein
VPNTAKLRRLKLLVLARNALDEAIKDLTAELRALDPSFVAPPATLPPPATTTSGTRPRYEPPDAKKKGST